MGEPLRKRRQIDDDALLRPADAPAEVTQADPTAAGAVRALQQQAGNAAVVGLLAQQGAAKAGGGSASKGGAGAVDSFEAQLFDQSILDPMRSLFAVVRDDPPDAEMALAKLEPIGQALWDYEQRFRGKDDALANAFLAARGWLGRGAAELRQRVGPVKPWTDAHIARLIQEMVEDMQCIRERLP